MRVKVDRAVCQGTGLCVALAPGVFEIADDGAVVARHETPDGDESESVAQAVRICPTGALSLEES